MKASNVAKTVHRVSLIAAGVAVTSLLFVACGTDKKSDSGSGTTTTAAVTWTNKDMQTLVTTTCAKSKCHDGTTSPNYKTITEANMKKDTTAKSNVDSKRMPTDTPYTAAQITIFDNFYK